jgi:glycine dehydrogenase subunit 1
MVSRTHRFLPNTPEHLKKQMLAEIGVASIGDLFSDIPTEVRLTQPVQILGMRSEQEVQDHLEGLLARNVSAVENSMFLGAGLYSHYIPAAVKAIMSRTEFQTSYTPYQAEISQGLLQGLFEFQSLMADLAAVDVVNSSLYDWSTALGESARMAVRATGRKKILVPRCLHPDKMSVLKNYTAPSGIEVETFGYEAESGNADLADLESKLDRNTAAAYCENPSFFGILDEHLIDVPSVCHRKGALAIVGFDPISLGGIKAPGEYGADIVIAEGQTISTEVNYGGPSLGIIGCRGENLIRQMPGRLIGMTTTVDGLQPAFSMVLQTREQHIRRERATSNICTNEALLAIGAAVYMSLMGPKGLRQLFETILTKTQYAMHELGSVSGLWVPRFASPHYQDFVVSVKSEKGSAKALQKKLLSKGMQFGKNLSGFFPELGESLLIAVTELTSQESIDRLRIEIEAVLGS